MQGARIRIFDLKRVKLVNTYLGSSIPLPPYERRKIEKILGQRIYWSGWYNKSLVLYLDKVLAQNELESLKNALSAEDVICIKRGQERGIIVGLYDFNNTYLGMGVINEIDFERNSIKISTPVNENPSLIVVGLIRLNNDFREIGKVKSPPF